MKDDRRRKDAARNSKKRAEERAERRPARGRKPQLRRVIRHPVFPWALVAVATAAAVTFAILWRVEAGEDRAAAEVRDAARRFLSVLTNFSAETIEEDIEEIRGFAEGGFAQEVDQTFSDARVAAIRENEVVSTGRVRSVFVQTVEGNTATVFGVVNETIVNASLTAPRADVLRVELELIETPDGWKVSSVQILQSPGAVPFG